MSDAQTGDDDYRAVYDALLLRVDDYNNKLKNYSMLIGVWLILFFLQLMLAFMGVVHQALALTIPISVVVALIRASDQCDLSGENLVLRVSDTAFTSALRSRRAISLEGVRCSTGPMWRYICSNMGSRGGDQRLVYALHSLLVHNVRQQQQEESK